MWGALLLVMLPGEVRVMDPKYRAEALGILTGISAIVALLAPLVIGVLSDRCASPWGRRRPFMAVGLVINVIGLTGMAWAYRISKPTDNAHSVWESIFGNPGFMFFFLAYLVVQFGNNTISAAFMGVIPDVVPDNQRGVASGYMALMSQLGSLFGALGAGIFLSKFAESIKFGLLIVVLVGVSLLTMLGMKETPLPFKPPKLDFGRYVKSLWISPKEYPDFAWVWITRALVMLGFYAVLPFINYYLIDVVGVPKEDVGSKASIVQAIILIASTISGFLGGKISDSIGRKKVVYVANMLIAVMAVAFIFCHSITDVLLAGTLFGIGYGAYISVDYALGADVLPSRKDAGKEMAVWHIAMTLPQSVASPIAGYLIALPGKKIDALVKGEEISVHYTQAGYANIFILCAVCFLLGAILLRNVKGVS
jgi:MFS family permease